MGVSTGTFFNSSRARENESDSGNILKVESTGFADRSGMNVRERKKEDMGDSQDFVPSLWENRTKE